LNLTEKVTEAMNSRVLFNIKISRFTIPVSDTVVVMWIIMASLAVFAVIFTRNLKSVPSGKQNVVEFVVDFVNNLAKSMIGHHWKPFAPYLGSVILFLALANSISLFNVIPSGEWLYGITKVDFFRHLPDLKPPTRDINVTACLAIMSILLVLFSGIWYKKPFGWLKGFIQPVPVVLPFKILDYFVRPLSLCLRLFGNILGAFIIMELLYIALPVFLPAVFSVYFDIFDGLLQAYIFVFLTTLYIAEAIE
jgi:F-type H+-transporting ATPase subunit a